MWKSSKKGEIFPTVKVLEEVVEKNGCRGSTPGISWKSLDQKVRKAMKLSANNRWKKLTTTAARDILQQSSKLTLSDR